ncbi:MAG: glycosyltransferase family 1 protein [Sphingomonadaceae bacterium]|nr:glycosyltransferase family 1 protein [Sphingomonadaceae bacterium]
MKLAIVSDAWAPQVNGVVRTLTTTAERLTARGHAVETVTPDQFRTIPCPTYPEIRLALGARGKVAGRLGRFAPDAVHIATEGPLGWAARRWCLGTGMPFTTSFHTRFPDYLAVRTRLPADLFWPLLRRFHGPASATFAATASLREELKGRGLPNTHIWARGVDLALFSPDNPPLPELAGLAGPIQLYVGRIAPEKNIEAFLASGAPGNKVVVGDGPARAELARRFPETLFLGPLHGSRLASAYASADVFVFPSRTDTFGLVMIEALASGVPVAAYPVPGPLDIIGPGGCGTTGGMARIGALSHDLDAAIRAALTVDRAACIAEGRRYDWERCTDQFVAGLSLRGTRRAA